METVSWNVFVSTGRVEDYLRYKGEDGQFPLGSGWREEPSKADRTGENAVWEKPLH